MSAKKASKPVLSVASKRKPTLAKKKSRAVAVKSKSSTSKGKLKTKKVQKPQKPSSALSKKAASSRVTRRKSSPVKASSKVKAAKPKATSKVKKKESKLPVKQSQLPAKEKLMKSRIEKKPVKQETVIKPISKKESENVKMEKSIVGTEHRQKVASQVEKPEVSKPNKKQTSALYEGLEEFSPTLPPPTGFMGIPPYQPQPEEPYMSPGQLKHFENILLTWKKALMEEVDRTMNHMKDEAANFPDPNDRASLEEEFNLELRARDRERKLIKKIDEALASIQEEDYGYCEACGVEIGIRRLEARPTATLCIDCKTLDEIKEKQISG